MTIAFSPRKPLPSLSSLQAFDLVSQVGGIRKAARLLNVDHTVVSRRLLALENYLEISLFDRRPDGLVLTQAGAEYHAAIAKALRAIETATSEILSEKEPRDLQIWAVPGFAAQWLSARFAEFERTAPGFLVELRPTDRVADLARHEADADIRYYGDSWGTGPDGPGKKSVELARPPLIAVASPQFLDKTGPVRTLEDLCAAPLLHEEDRQQWSAWLKSNGVAAGAPSGGVILWHAHLAIAGAKQGRGVALTNSYLVGKDLIEGRLVELQIDNAVNAPVGRYCFVCREDRWNDPALRLLRQFLLKCAQAGGD
ncbi:LysR substrate-binding domain-containing protein [Henriciella litoralis]|uniref:LysR substrate-binding domain-containing protein n=1 Tax=Henriciella litoralis TaxID=568102 RepID=UPI0009FB998F|nr:LysR substrate-binding domain-containing protein [Henriciella litoralis]